MVIDLTNSEKRTFLRFLFLYLASSFIFLLMIAFFYFENEKKLYFDLVKSNMKNTAAKISSTIILAHMSNARFDASNALNINGYKISLYDNNRKKILGTLDEKIDFTKELSKTKDGYILVDKSVLGHLDVFYIALKENLFVKKIQEVKSNIIIFFLAIYTLISLIGYYLARLFLMPIRNERIKLNNFIKDTTHELNTPISALLMSTESKNLNEKQIQRIKLSAKRISEVYKDLSYIFLQENEEKKLEKLNLKELLQEQLEYFKVIANKKKITLDIKLEDMYYEINKEDFIRLTNNIISNAIKYNKLNGKLKIYLQNNTLEIHDEGIGIEQNKIDDIFKRYYRASSQEGGFGIGLNIVNLICEKYDINIQVNSQINKGTSFILNF